MKSYRFIVKGVVQGVGFRNYTKYVADKIKVCGYVKNLDDGTVEAVATLSDERLEEFLFYLNKGPINAVVYNVEHEPIDEHFTDRFIVKK